jgi:D-inositol-3-phosphate glycosyltransferase
VKPLEAVDSHTGVRHPTLARDPHQAHGVLRSTALDEMTAALLTGGFDRPYAYGLAMALVSKGIRLEVIGSDEIESSEMHTTPNLSFLNLQGSKRETSIVRKISRVLLFYARLILYSATARPRIFHILWNNKFQFIDRTLLMLYYKLLGKRVVFTAHNVNAGKRDGSDSLLNRLTLTFQYRLADHIFVHTEKMKTELLEEFGVRANVVSVIPFGINNSVPNTDVTFAEARRRLGIRNEDKTILFFGNIGPYKGLEFLIQAFQRIAVRNADYRLIIAGKLRGDSEKYWNEVHQAIGQHVSRARITLEIRYIPDEDTELYFKAADVFVLPYTHVFQSGVLFLGYSFGLPVVATDVGSLREDIVEGRTGFVCKRCDADDLAWTIEKYFASDLFRDLESRRREIRDFANAQHSWAIVGDVTRHVYADLLARQLP